MTMFEGLPQNPEAYALELLIRTESALRRAVGIIAPDEVDKNPLEVFPAPGEIRDRDEGLHLSPEQEMALRAVARELAVGRDSDLTLSEQGLQGAHVVIEGGQPHKMFAELSLVAGDREARPTTLVVCGSPWRKIMDEAERNIAARLGVGSAGEYSEYDVAERLVRKIRDFVTFEKEADMGFVYDIHKDYALREQRPGQFRMIGTLPSAAVIMMRVDRQNYVDEQGADKYRLQPTAADVMDILSRMRKAATDDALTPMAYVTSATYQPSRAVDAALVGLTTERVIGLASYGRARLAMAQGMPESSEPTPVPIHQIPGELYMTALETERLRSRLADLRLL